MPWIIRDGFIENQDGDGIYIADPSGGGEISGMTFRGGTGAAINLGGLPSVPRFGSLDELLELIEANVGALRPADRPHALAIISEMHRDRPAGETASAKLRPIYDFSIAAGAAGLIEVLKHFIAR